MAETIKRVRKESSSARVPRVPVGTALIFTRYDVEKSVVLSPEDFNRLADLDAALAEIATDRPVPSELALLAHALEDEPHGPVEDPEAIRAYFGIE